ncbi:MAG: hypothetical protein QT08_C0014G0015 [archaeon GW2011_AR17]|nr:MAG: hypothetical protein QT08_C0014G0015 [archaeon GW2011_AR17]MBS3154590.1 hypothetical protein [Candidatus Woesearchaeota archaeon]HIH14910.1 hypothetical protein [Nanoarchaeota archaeon]HIH58952.1 hypothetical protein [Nanoarchaeota archaeon]HII14221.1 hypothetical protein [Nanoarchaeota archaeon]
MFGFFQKRSDKKVEELERSIKNSFGNMRADMGHVSQWITHFKTRHEDHSKKFDELDQRIIALEQMLAVKQSIFAAKDKRVRVQEEDEEERNASDEELPEIEEQLGPLPYAQARVCQMLAACHREEGPDNWISLSRLAVDVYPGKEYKDVRSAILQLVNVLEVEGYLVKKKVRKSVYVYMKKEFRSQYKGKDDIPIPEKKGKQRNN